MGWTERRALRGKHISMVMQDPEVLAELGDVRRQGLLEAYRVHTRVSAAEAREKAIAMLAVQIREPGRVHDLTARGFRRHGPARDDRDDAHRRAGRADRGSSRPPRSMSPCRQILDILERLGLRIAAWA